MFTHLHITILHAERTQSQPRVVSTQQKIIKMMAILFIDYFMTLLKVETSVQEKQMFIVLLRYL